MDHNINFTNYNQSNLNCTKRQQALDLLKRLCTMISHQLLERQKDNVLINQNVYQRNKMFFFEKSKFVMGKR